MQLIANEISVGTQKNFRVYPFLEVSGMEKVFYSLKN